MPKSGFEYQRCVHTWLHRWDSTTLYLHIPHKILFWNMLFVFCIFNTYFRIRIEFMYLGRYIHNFKLNKAGLSLETVYIVWFTYFQTLCFANIFGSKLLIYCYQLLCNIRRWVKRFLSCFVLKIGTQKIFFGKSIQWTIF